MWIVNIQLQCYVNKWHILISDNEIEVEEGQKETVPACFPSSTVELIDGKKMHRCGVCLKLFRRAPYLKIHMRSHTGERPYKYVVRLSLSSHGLGD